MFSILSVFSRLLNTVKDTLCMTPFHVKSLLKDYNPSASVSMTLYIKKKKKITLTSITYDIQIYFT